MYTYLKEHTALLSVKVRPAEKRRLAEEANRRGVSLSTLVREALGLHEPVAPLPKRRRGL